MFAVAITLTDRARIAIHPAICGGRPTMARTRIRVTDILDALSEGVSEEELVVNFPYVTLEDICACLRYVASIAEEPRRCGTKFVIDAVGRHRPAPDLNEP
jgi:uncharacterized protein (DUF433 family)